jgi:hypothetical protein
VKLVIVTVCPDVILVLFNTRSVVVFPWTWQTGPLSYIRKLAAVPVAEAATVQLPAIVVTPPELVRNEAGSGIVASKPVGSAAAQFAGSAPLNIFSVAPAAPIVV